MFATVSTWRLTGPPTTAAGWNDFVRDLVGRGISAARAMHVHDMVVIAVEPDRLIVVCQFETEAEAIAAERATLAFADAAYTAEAVSLERSTGRVFELGRYARLDRSHVQDRAAPRGAMFAQIVHWRLATDVQDPAALDRFLSQAWSQAAPFLRAVGLYDIVAVQAAPDLLMAIRLYGGDTRVDHAWHRAMERVRGIMSDGATVAAEFTGRAWDTQVLLDYLS
jgi:hypothetical protein